MSKDYISISKKLSYQLRHNLQNIPETLPNGFVPLHVILKKRDFNGVTNDDIYKVVETNGKKRFELYTSESGIVMIRASQGHSQNAGNVVDMSKLLKKINEPLPYCVHGTSRLAYENIKLHGLSRMNRTHIHCASSPYATSGFRSSSQVLIHINMQKAMRDGIDFYQSVNGVILSEGKDGIIHPVYFDNVEFVQ